MTFRMRIISAVAGVAAVLATVAVARTIHTHTAAGPQQTRGTVGVAPAQPATPFQAGRNFACGLPSQAACDTVETWFPE
jgi:hypothetical protein